MCSSESEHGWSLEQSDRSKEPAECRDNRRRALNSGMIESPAQFTGCHPLTISGPAILKLLKRQSRCRRLHVSALGYVFQ